VKLITETVKECQDISSEGPRLDIELACVHPVKDLEHHCLGTISKPTAGSNRNVLIEWLYYGTQVLPETEAKKRTQRVEAVTKLLNSIPHPPAFRLLRCSNFFHDPENSRFRLAFNFPFPVQLDGVSSKDHGVTTLSELLARSQEDRNFKKPSLGERFRLAQALTSSISKFHKVGWLHRNISPYNVVFSQVDGSPAY